MEVVACLPSCSPYAVATLLVATESKGTLNSLVTVLYTDRAIPTPASCTAPAAVIKDKHQADLADFAWEHRKGNVLSADRVTS